MVHENSVCRAVRRPIKGAIAGRAGALFAIALMTGSLLAQDAQARRRRSAPKAPKTLGAREIQPGMKGYGLTVMRGTKVERFQVEFIGVLHNKLPQQDMIMIRCSGLNLEHSGIIAGMSGSPIYVKHPKKGDLLVGALSYGFGFNKDPVAGVTPIADMLPELDRKRSPVPPTQRIGKPGKRRAMRVNLPGMAAGELRPVAIPLGMAGFHPDVVNEFRESFGAQGFHVMAASGGGSSQKPSPRFEPGSAVSLTLTRGDMSIAGVGTVTWVRGNRFIAFGHPFQGLGQVHLPIGGAHIVWVLASQRLSFKMGYPLRSSGVLDQDRQPAVAGREGPVAQMIPMDLEVIGKGTKSKRRWRVEVTDQPYFFPLAVSAVGANAVRVSEPMIENASLKAQMIFTLEGNRKPIVLRDHFLGLNGMRRMSAAQMLARKVTKALVFNGFERLRVTSIRARFEAEVARPLAFLDGVRMPAQEVDVGEQPVARIEFMLPNKGRKVFEMKLPTIPRVLAGEKIKVWIGPERLRAPERPVPGDIDDMLEAIHSYIPRNRLAAVITLPDRSWMMRGQRLTDLPAGVLDELNGHPRKIKAGKETIRSTVDIPWIINGSRLITLQVRSQP